MSEQRHYPLWRDITWLEDGGECSAEVEVCGTCVPKHSGFSSRADVPEWPCALADQELVS